MSFCPRCHGSERFCICEEEKNETEMNAVKKELEIYRLRLAGALMASEGANPLIFKEKDVLPEIRDCPTINSILDLYEEKERCKLENEMLENDNDELQTIIDTLIKEIAELKKLLESK